MKPFNLVAALAGAPVVTRDGTPFTNVQHFPSATAEYNLAGVNKGMVKLFKDDGTASDGPYLFMASVKRTVWVNMYRSSIGLVTGVVTYKSKREGEEFVDRARCIGTYPLEIEA